MTFAFVSHLSRSFPRSTYRNDEKYQGHRGSPSSPTPNLVGTTVPQGTTFRPCCLDSSRAVFPTFWWGGIWPWASANAILFRSPPPHPILSRPPSFFVPFSLRITRPPPSRVHFDTPIPAYRYPAVCLNTWNTIRNNTEYHRNGGWQWEMEICMIVIWMKSNDNRMSKSNTFAYNIIA